jgi:hypothetical protein
MFEPASRFFDLFHYHYGLSILPNHRDIKILRSLGKPVVMHHWGNDVRTREMATVNNRFVYTGDCPDSDKVHRDLTTLKEYITDAIVQDYEVYPYVAPYYKRVHVIPIAINMRLFKPYYPDVDVRKPTILHAPTNQDFKGTQYIEQAIEKLKLERNFNYIRVEKMEHQKAIALYKKADIIIDQILCGSYGLLSVEGMAYGKPVVAYIREDLAAREDAPPIHNANPETIYDVLKYLIDHPEVRHRSGVAGREYVKRSHDSNVVIKKIMDVYQLAMSEV